MVSVVLLVIGRMIFLRDFDIFGDFLFVYKLGLDIVVVIDCVFFVYFFQLIFGWLYVFGFIYCM